MKKLTHAIAFALVTFSALPLFTACAADSDLGEGEGAVGEELEVTEDALEPTAASKVCGTFKKGKLVACTSKLCPAGYSLSHCPTSLSVRCCR